MGLEHSPPDFREQQQVQAHYRHYCHRCFSPQSSEEALDLRIDPVALMIVHVPVLVELQNMADLGEVGADPEHELIEDRPGCDANIHSEAVDELMVDECVVGVGIVAAVELDEVGRDVVGVLEGGQVLLEEAADDAEGEPVVRAEDAVDGLLGRDVPHAVVLHRVADLAQPALLDLLLLLLQHCLEHVVAGYVVRVLLPAEEDALSLRLLVQLLPRSPQRVLQPVQHVGQKLGLWLGDERPNLDSREEVDLLLEGLIVYYGGVAAHDCAEREGDDFRLRGDAILHPFLGGEVVEPGEVAEEEGVGVQPHASVLVDEKEAHEVGPVLLADFVDGAAVDAVEARLAVAAEEARVVEVGEEAELPPTGTAEVRHVVDAHPREQLGAVEARVPKGPQDLGDLVELPRLQPHHQQHYYHPNPTHLLQLTQGIAQHCNRSRTAIKRVCW